MVKRILIVDDEQDILDSVKSLVETMGYEAEIVNNGIKALEILKKEKFDLVLLDILMPEMSGREVLEKLREDSKLKNQKVAFMTVVQLGREGVNEVKKLKPVEYFEKPIDVNDFKPRLKKILG
jgi:CheY-like chemotaxis protein